MVPYEYPVENAEVHYLNEEKPEAIDETTTVMVYDSGSCGEALTWEIDSRGTLTISGTGEMKEFGYDEVTPWDDYSKKIRTVVLKNGVTSISRAAFINCVNLTSVDVPKSVTRVGEDAFLKTMYYSDEKNWENGVLYVGSALVKAKSEEVKGEYVIKDGTTTISERAFDCCVDLTELKFRKALLKSARKRSETA